MNLILRKHLLTISSVCLLLNIFSIFSMENSLWYKNASAGIWQESSDLEDSYFIKAETSKKFLKEIRKSIKQFRRCIYDNDLLKAQEILRLHVNKIGNIINNPSIMVNVNTLEELKNLLENPKKMIKETLKTVNITESDTIVKFAIKVSAPFLLFLALANFGFIFNDSNQEYYALGGWNKANITLLMALGFISCFILESECNKQMFNTRNKAITNQLATMKKMVLTLINDIQHKIDLFDNNNTACSSHFTILE